MAACIVCSLGSWDDGDDDDAEGDDDEGDDDDDVKATLFITIVQC